MEARHDHVTVVHDNSKIVVLGGWKYDGILLATVEMLDTTTQNAWTTLPPMPTARRAFAATVAGSSILAVGGYVDYGPSNTAELLDLNSIQCSSGRPVESMNQETSVS